MEDYIVSLADSDADRAAAIQKARFGTVIVNIPEFMDDYDIRMKDMLVGMGMQDVFDPEKADPDILGKCFLTYMNKTSIFRIHNSSGYLVILHKQNTSL